MILINKTNYFRKNNRGIMKSNFTTLNYKKKNCFYNQDYKNIRRNVNFKFPKLTYRDLKLHSNSDQKIFSFLTSFILYIYNTGHRRIEEFIFYFIGQFFRMFSMTLFRIITLFNVLVLSRTYLSYFGVQMARQEYSWKKPKPNKYLVILDGTLDIFRGLIPPLFNFFDPGILLYFYFANFLLAIFDVRANSVF